MADTVRDGRLTDSVIQGLKPPVSGVLERADSGKGATIGLRIRVGPTGIKSFVLRTRVGAKMKVLTLGRYGSLFGLAEARKTARQMLADLEAGKDPKADTKKAARTGTERIADLYETWCIQHVNLLRSAKEVKRIFATNILPILGDRIASTVERKDIIRLVDDIVYADRKNPKPVMGRAVLAQLSSFFSWCLSRDIVAINPCFGAKKPIGGKPRDRVLTDAELKRLWDCATQEGWPFGDAIKLLLLTGARRAEVFGARWSEIDLKGQIWTLPAERAKNDQVHMIPLSKPALDILKSIQRLDGEALLFPAANGSGKSASGISRVKRRLDVALGTDDWVIHDLRRTVATGLQRLGIRFEVTEAILNHVSGAKGGVAGIYQRHNWADEKRDALQRWSQELLGIVR